MNIRSLLVALSAVSALALAACTVTTSSGSGGSSSTTSGTTSSSSGGGQGGQGTGGEGTGGAGGQGTGGEGGGGACHKCAEVITDPSIDPNTLCQDSGTLYDALAQCTCMGACATDCGDNVCMSMSASQACITCLQDTNMGCGMEFNDCSNDL
ncbi:MAG: hypothetical protein U0359_07670 [Byssovorax sp.]